jgi:hypothetical protein
MAGADLISAAAKAGTRRDPAVEADKLAPGKERGYRLGR